MPALTPKFLICALAGWAGLALLPVQASAADFDLAETAGPMRTWRSSDGLLSDSVTAIIQTHDGFLWVGTGAGLVRFDGVKFTGVKLAGQSTNAPTHVTALCEDNNGCLWIGTQDAGLFEMTEGRGAALHGGAGVAG